MGWLHAQFTQAYQLLEAGGWILWAIALVALWLWTLVFERLWYAMVTLPRDIDRAVRQWESVRSRDLRQMQQLRRILLAGIARELNRHMTMVRLMVRLCPLLGLLGTAYGLASLFRPEPGVAIPLSSGIAAVTMPILAGLVTALSGLLAMGGLGWFAKLQGFRLERRLVVEHGQSLRAAPIAGDDPFEMADATMGLMLDVIFIPLVFLLAIAVIPGLSGHTDTRFDDGFVQPATPAAAVPAAAASRVLDAPGVRRP